MDSASFARPVRKSVHRPLDAVDQFLLLAVCRPWCNVRLRPKADVCGLHGQKKLYQVVLNGWKRRL